MQAPPNTCFPHTLKINTQESLVGINTKKRNTRFSNFFFPPPNIVMVTSQFLVPVGLYMVDVQKQSGGWGDRIAIVHGIRSGK